MDAERPAGKKAMAITILHPQVFIILPFGMNNIDVSILLSWGLCSRKRTFSPPPPPVFNCGAQARAVTSIVLTIFHLDRKSGHRQKPLFSSIWDCVTHRKFLSSLSELSAVFVQLFFELGLLFNRILL